eukprot:TRINITY_DN181_c0_g2_i3.p1 TRINITY_DN181_c0_g2~~TRINITY_DN181_c0_g2_i3.p1  ORF type:complete len:1298 (+),score=366.72 TRINITY_DN181_c0_g2_i3:69-3896(+)
MESLSSLPLEQFIHLCPSLLSDVHTQVEIALALIHRLLESSDQVDDLFLRESLHILSQQCNPHPAITQALLDAVEFLPNVGLVLEHIPQIVGSTEEEFSLCLGKAKDLLLSGECVPQVMGMLSELSLPQNMVQEASQWAIRALDWVEADDFPVVLRLIFSQSEVRKDVISQVRLQCASLPMEVVLTLSETLRSAIRFSSRVANSFTQVMRKAEVWSSFDLLMCFVIMERQSDKDTYATIAIALEKGSLDPNLLCNVVVNATNLRVFDGKSFLSFLRTLLYKSDSMIVLSRILFDVHARMRLDIVSLLISSLSSMNWMLSSKPTDGPSSLSVPGMEGISMEAMASAALRALITLHDLADRCAHEVLEHEDGTLIPYYGMLEETFVEITRFPSLPVDYIRILSSTMCILAVQSHHARQRMLIIMRKMIGWGNENGLLLFDEACRHGLFCKDEQNVFLRYTLSPSSPIFNYERPITRISRTFDVFCRLVHRFDHPAAMQSVVEHPLEIVLSKMARLSDVWEINPFSPKFLIYSIGCFQAAFTSQDTSLASTILRVQFKVDWKSVKPWFHSDPLHSFDSEITQLLYETVLVLWKRNLVFLAAKLLMSENHFLQMGLLNAEFMDLFGQVQEKLNDQWCLMIPTSRMASVFRADTSLWMDTVFALQHSFFMSIDPPSAIGILESNRSASADFVNKDIVKFVLRWFSDIAMVGSFGAQHHFSRIPVHPCVDRELISLEDFYEILSCPHSFILEIYSTSSSLRASTLKKDASLTHRVEFRTSEESGISAGRDHGKEESEGTEHEKLEYGTGRWIEFVDLQKCRHRDIFRKIFVDSQFSIVHSACLEQWIHGMINDDLVVRGEGLFGNIAHALSRTSCGSQDGDVALWLEQTRTREINGFDACVARFHAMKELYGALSCVRSLLYASYLRQNACLLHFLLFLLRNMDQLSEDPNACKQMIRTMAYDLPFFVRKTTGRPIMSGQVDSIGVSLMRLMKKSFHPGFTMILFMAGACGKLNEIVKIILFSIMHSAHPTYANYVVRSSRLDSESLAIHISNVFSLLGDFHDGQSAVEWTNIVHACTAILLRKSRFTVDHASVVIRILSRWIGEKATGVIDMLAGDDIDDDDDRVGAFGRIGFLLEMSRVLCSNLRSSILWNTVERAPKRRKTIIQNRMRMTPKLSARKNGLLSSIEALEKRIEESWEHCISEGKKIGIEVFVTIGIEEEGEEDGKAGDMALENEGCDGMTDHRMEQVDTSLMDTIRGFEGIVLSLMKDVEQLGITDCCP